jgi:EmrB/QacA subfamily drug resistance transporter
VNRSVKTLSRSTKVLALVAIGTFLTALDVTIVNVAYKSIRSYFGATTLLPWIISGYAISFAAGLLTAGRLAESFGRKRAFLTGLSIFGIASVLCGVATSVPMLIASRVIQALGAALIVPSATALVMPEFPLERRAAAAGMLAASGGLGAGTGPVVGGLLVDWIGWRSIFFVTAPVCAFAVVVGRRLLRESTSSGPARIPDFLGAALALFSVALLTLALVQSEEWGWRSKQLIGSIVVSIALGSIFVQRSRRHREPVLDLTLFELRYVTAANVAGILYAAGFYSFNFLMVQWLREVWEYTPSRTGLAALATPMCSMAVSPLGGRLAQRYGHKRVAVPGLLLFAASAGSMSAFLTVRHNYWTVFFPCLVALGVSIGLSISVLSSAASAYLPRDRFAMGSALYATGRQVGGALGIAIVTAISAGIANPVSSYRWSWRYVSVVMCAAAIVMALMFRPPSSDELSAAR